MKRFRQPSVIPDNILRIGRRVDSPPVCGPDRGQVLTSQLYTDIWPLVCFTSGDYLPPRDHRHGRITSAMWFDAEGQVVGCTPEPRFLRGDGVRLGDVVLRASPLKKIESTSFYHLSSASKADWSRAIPEVGKAVWGPYHYSSLTAARLHQFVEGALEEPVVYTRVLAALAAGVFEPDWDRQP